MQRKMLRKMVGWIILPTDTWESAGSRMKCRFDYHIGKYGMRTWSELVSERKSKVMHKMSEWLVWTQLSMNWDPPTCEIFNLHLGKRLRGRPCTRWYDSIIAFLIVSVFPINPNRHILGVRSDLV